MRVKLVQIDGKLPNLALMRLSAWYRRQGAEIVFTRETKFDGRFDHVYGSSIFKFSESKIDRLRDNYPFAVVGGTGTGNRLTVEFLIDNDVFSELDYSLYPDYEASIGFTQRGCRLSCKFCVVPEKEGRNRSVASIAEIWRGPGHAKKLHLLDNDFFGQPEEQWRARIEEIKAGKFKVCLNQGINVRHITPEAAAALASIEFRDDQFTRRRLYTAWDNLKDEALFFSGVEMLEDAGVLPKQVMVYMLVGYDKKETWERVWYRFHRMKERGLLPYPMVFDCRAEDPDRYRKLKQFQRWVVTGLYRAVSWDEYDPGKKSRKTRA